jgi:hypothetical protein
MARSASIAVLKVFNVVRQVLVVLLPLAGVACGGSDLTLPLSAVPAEVTIVKGNGQSGAPGTMLQDSIVVEVVDSSGSPLAGLPVEFQPQSSGSAVLPATSITDVNGIAGARWVLGMAPGSQQVIARVVGVESAELEARFTAIAEAGLPSAPRLVIATQPSTTAEQGEVFASQPVVQIRDASGGDLAASGVAVTAAVLSGSGTLVGTTVRFTDGSGRAVFSDLRVEGATGPHLLIFAAPGYTTAVSEPVNVSPVTPGKAATSTQITAHDPNPSSSGQSVLVGFSVSSDAGAPGGTVTVTASGGNETCSGLAPSGSCSLTLTGSGDRVLTATYNGDDRFLGSSAQVTHTVTNDGGGGGGGGGGTGGGGTGGGGTGGGGTGGGGTGGGGTGGGGGGTGGGGGGTGGGGTGGGGGGGANLPPTAISDEYRTIEGWNHTLTVSAAGGVLQNDRDPEGGRLTATYVSGPSNGRVDLNPDGSFSYTPVAEYYGSDHFTYRASDQAGNSSTAVVTIQVAPVNDSPRFDDRGDPPVVEPDAGPQRIEGWATDIEAGGPNESHQTVTFVTVANSNPDLFTSDGQPAVTRDGTLTYTPSGQTGSSTVSVQLQDDGGTENGGFDTSRLHTFTIRVQ